MKTFIWKKTPYRLFAILLVCFNLGLIQARGEASLKIVSLSPSCTQILYELGAEELLVGCTSYCLPALEDGKTVVANALNLQVEKILSLNPQLVLASGLNDRKQLKQLQAFGLQVLVYKTPQNFSELGADFLDIAQHIGYEPKAQTQWKKLQARVQALQDKLPKGEGIDLLIQIGSDPLFVVIPGSFMHDYITLLGCRSVTEGLVNPALSKEAVLSRDPQAIFVVSMGVVGEEQQKAWEQFAEMRAVQAQKIFIVDSNKACLPSPLLFVESLEYMAACLYPAHFNR